jgi:two-component system OmpR family response regulator
VTAPMQRKPAHRVLLVEDHAALGEATAALMRFHGLEVRVATTGGDALRMAEEFNPVLILCDMMLPDMAGLDVAQAVRARRPASDVLIAILTAMSTDGLSAVEGKTTGVDLFLSKPLTNNTLLALVARLALLPGSL